MWSAATVEAKEEVQGGSTRRTGQLFIYFAIMQVIVIISTIVAVQRVTESQNRELGQLHSKLDQIFNDHEERERLSREHALNGTHALTRPAANQLPPLPLPHSAPAQHVYDPPAQPLPTAPSTAVTAPAPPLPPPGGGGGGGGAGDKVPQRVAPGHEAAGLGAYDPAKFKEVESIEGMGVSEWWVDGFAENGNCSKALQMPDGGGLKRVLMPNVEPLVDPHVWLLNVGAGTTGTRTVQREICKRQINSTHWHWHCNLPEDDPSCKAMESWIEWLQPFYAITENNQFWVRKGLAGEVPSRPSDELIHDALFNGLSSLGDTPVAYFPELVAWMPKAKVILTLRDPEKWWKSRVEHHAGDLMCAEEYWEQVAHPFSISDCFRLGGNAGLINIKNFPKRVGIEGFIRYNKWIVSVVPKDRLFRFCPWDCRDEHCTQDGSTNYFTKKMLFFIKEYCPPPCRGGSHVPGYVVQRPHNNDQHPQHKGHAKL